MSAAELDSREKAEFLEWRASLAKLELDELLVFSPFEKNLEVWRQLWRVVERSDVVVQVVDARNPEFFRCGDFENYVNEVGKQQQNGKRNILLLNKADLLTVEERRAWMEYFKDNGIEFLFWSAFAALNAHEKMLEAKALAAAKAFAAEDSDSDDGIDPGAQEEEEVVPVVDISEAGERVGGLSNPVEKEHRGDFLSTEHVLTQTELLDHLMFVAEEVRKMQGKPEGASMTIGMVGYPNVGKSSTINALLCEKRVGVDSRPGKTKHFQTLPLGEGHTLCDCPGLVFPSFSQSKDDMYCNGVLPIDNLRDQGAGPVSVLCERIPRRVWRKTYNMVLDELTMREDLKGDIGSAALDAWGETFCDSKEVLEEIATLKGYLGSHSVPDQSRAARLVLKDYVNGKLLYVYGPPGVDFAGLHMEGGSHEDKPDKAARRAKKKPTGNGFAALLGDDESGEESEEEEQEELVLGGGGDDFTREMEQADVANATLEAAMLATEERMRALQAIEESH